MSTCIRGEQRGEQREKKNRERERRRRGSERTRYLKLHGSVYYLSSAISASTEKVHPTEDRRMICAPDALESARSIKEDAHTACDRPRIAIWISFSIVAERCYSFFFFILSLARKETRKTVFVRQVLFTEQHMRIKRNTLDAAFVRNEDAIEESETRRPVRIALYLTNAITSCRAPRKTYMLPDIFKYSITATRGIAPRTRRKNVINRSLAGRDILRVHVPSSRVHLYVHRFSSRTKGSIPECRSRQVPDRNPEFKSTRVDENSRDEEVVAQTNGEV